MHGRWYICVTAGRLVIAPTLINNLLYDTFDQRKVTANREISKRSSSKSMRKAKSKLTRLAAWVSDRNVPFLVTSIGMVVMLLWAGSYKMTALGAEGIIPLASNGPLDDLLVTERAPILACLLDSCILA
jgi:hypothetical protein